MAKLVKTQENKTEKVKKTRRSKGEGSFGKTRRADTLMFSNAKGV